jgi:hypothetical protein
MRTILVALMMMMSCAALAQETGKEKTSQDSTSIRIVCSATIRTDAPLYIVDNMEVCAEDLNKLNPNQIASIHVLKQAKDVEAYGEKGKHGVILIEMKNSKKKNSKTE